MCLASVHAQSPRCSSVRRAWTDVSRGSLHPRLGQDRSIRIAGQAISSQVTHSALDAITRPPCSRQAIHAGIPKEAGPKNATGAPPSLELHSVAKLHRHAAAELVLNMRADDRVKTVFRLEAQFLGAARDEFLRPAADDPL